MARREKKERKQIWKRRTWKYTDVQYGQKKEQNKGGTGNRITVKLKKNVQK